MRIAIIASGSRGDIQPYLALGKGLQTAGHTVRLVTHQDYGMLVKAHRVEFWPVAGGDHVISIRVEDVPLPWGLEDETPRRINVPVRGRVTVDFGLVRLDG